MICLSEEKVASFPVLERGLTLYQVKGLCSTVFPFSWSLKLSFAPQFPQLGFALDDLHVPRNLLWSQWQLWKFIGNLESLHLSNLLVTVTHHFMRKASFYGSLVQLGVIKPNQKSRVALFNCLLLFMFSLQTSSQFLWPCLTFLTLEHWLEVASSSILSAGQVNFTVNKPLIRDLAIKSTSLVYPGFKLCKC